MSRPASETPSRPASAVPEPIHRLLALFAGHLSDVRFPDVDAESLGRLVAAVETHATAVAEAEAVLATARELHAEARAALLRTAELGIGYARVFAGEDTPLRNALDELDLGRAPSKPRTAPRRRSKAGTRSTKGARGEGVTKLPFPGAAEAGAA